MCELVYMYISFQHKSKQEQHQYIVPTNDDQFQFNLFIDSPNMFAYIHIT